MTYESARELVDSVGADAAPSLHAGFGFLQGHLGGLDPGDVVTVAGRTNAGKSMFALAHLNAFATHGMRSLYISCEDGRHRVARRLRHHASPDVFVTFPGIATSEGLKKHLRDAAEVDIRVVCVDYFQLVRYTGEEKPWSFAQGLAMALAEIKAVAAELGLVLLVVSQTTRPQPGESENLPRLYEMKESAALENAADVVLIVGDVKGRPTVCVAKAKDAPRGARFTLVRDPDGSLREPTDDDRREEETKRAPGPNAVAVVHDDW